VQLQPAIAGGTSGLVTEGPWALFRMFDKLSLVQSGGPERFKVTFNVDNRKATFEVTASSVVNPFKLPELASFGCPNAI
jgi:type VI secretion system protein ImpL